MRWVEDSTGDAPRGYLDAVLSSARRPYGYRTAIGELLGRPSSGTPVLPARNAGMLVFPHPARQLPGGSAAAADVHPVRSSAAAQLLAAPRGTGAASASPEPAESTSPGGRLPRPTAKLGAGATPMRRRAEAGPAAQRAAPGQRRPEPGPPTIAAPPPAARMPTPTPGTAGIAQAPAARSEVGGAPSGSPQLAAADPVRTRRESTAPWSEPVAVPSPEAADAASPGRSGIGPDDAAGGPAAPPEVPEPPQRPGSATGATPRAASRRNDPHLTPRDRGPKSADGPEPTALPELRTRQRAGDADAPGRVPPSGTVVAPEPPTATSTTPTPQARVPGTPAPARPAPQAQVVAPRGVAGVPSGSPHPPVVSRLRTDAAPMAAPRRVAAAPASHGERAAEATAAVQAPSRAVTPRKPFVPQYVRVPRASASGSQSAERRAQLRRLELRGRR